MRSTYLFAINGYLVLESSAYVWHSHDVFIAHDIKSAIVVKSMGWRGGTVLRSEAKAFNYSALLTYSKS